MHAHYKHAYNVSNLIFDLVGRALLSAFEEGGIFWVTGMFFLVHRKIRGGSVRRVRRVNDGKINARRFGPESKAIAIQIALLRRMNGAAKQNKVKMI